MRAGRAEEAEAFAQLGQQVAAGVFRNTHSRLVAAPKLVVLANANIKCGPAGKL